MRVPLGSGLKAFMIALGLFRERRKSNEEAQQVETRQPPFGGSSARFWLSIGGGACSLTFGHNNMRYHLAIHFMIFSQFALADETSRFKTQLAACQQVVLVCIYKEWNGSPYNWDREGTVVQSLKGKWKVGDRIHFYVSLDEKTLPSQYPSEIGRLKYLFLDNYSTKEVLLQTGASAPYKPELAKIASALVAPVNDAEQGVAPNRSLPSSQNSTSPVRGSED